MEDRILKAVIDAQNGSEEAFLILYDRYYSQAFHYAIKLTHNEADAKDATQEAFITIHAEIKNLRNPEYFNAWMSRIVFSKCTHIFRKNKDVILDDEKLIGLPNQVVRYKDYLPEASIHEVTDIEIVHQLMSELSDKVRDVMELIYLHGYSIKDVSTQLKIPEGTIKSRMNQGRKLLKEKIEKYELMEGRAIDFKMDTPFSLGILAFLSKLKHLKTTSSVVAVKAIVLVIITSVSVMGIGKAYTSLRQNKKSYEQQMAMSNVPSKEEQTFEPIYYREKQIVTYKNAYYTLMDWAANENEMSEKTSEEIAEIQAIVDFVASSDSVYKQMLEQKEWFTYFKTL